ncbi:hypothetical protein GOP47_0022430 [Adiantum capillus-veneris]|uniref:Uncharacterized protein n=1 Tax=Adiantum capillus-veneris TaxID=13818 RepID=A0A9D4U7Q8_ADICA|nr:hypothetical protein GOP47_0022430 [Adiantum capillus-veneris]
MRLFLGEPLAEVGVLIERGASRQVVFIVQVLVGVGMHGVVNVLHPILQILAHRCRISSCKESPAALALLGQAD